MHEPRVPPECHRGPGEIGLAPAAFNLGLLQERGDLGGRESDA
jgi:hypothetical protein